MPFCLYRDQLVADCNSKAYALRYDKTAFDHEGDDEVIVLTQASRLVEGRSNRNHNRNDNDSDNQEDYFLQVDRLRIPDCVVPSDEVFVAIIQALPAMRHITFGCIPAVTPIGFMDAFANCTMFHIATIEVTENAFSTAIFGIMFDIFPYLSSVIIRKNDTLRNSHLIRWAKKNDLRMMTCLKLIDCYLVTNDSIKHLIRGCRNLSELQIAGQPVEEGTLSKIMYYLPMSHLIMDHQMIAHVDIDLMKKCGIKLTFCTREGEETLCVHRSSAPYNEVVLPSHIRNKARDRAFESKLSKDDNDQFDCYDRMETRIYKRMAKHAKVYAKVGNKRVRDPDSDSESDFDEGHREGDRETPCRRYTSIDHLVKLKRGTV